MRLLAEVYCNGIWSEEAVPTDWRKQLHISLHREVLPFAITIAGLAF